MNFNIFLIQLYTLIRRECVRIFRIWIQSLLGPVVNIFLYFVIFGHIVGQRIGLIEHVAYLNYITPALIVLAAINASYSQVSSSFFIVRFQRNIEELLVSPISNFTLMLGFILAGILRGLIVSCLLTCIVIGVFQVQLHIHFKVLLDMMMVTCLFSCLGLFNGIFAKDFDDIALIPLFVITPLGYLGGAFYTLSMLPSSWQIIAKFNPLYHIFQMIRADTLGINNGEGSMTLILIFALIFMFFMIAYKMIKKPGYVRL